jgi:SnoaL-like domain
MDTLPDTWCRMWNDDPKLAHELVSADFRMWFGGSDGADAVRGPDGLAAFVEDYRRIQGITFAPRIVAVDDSGARIAYSWDATFPDGSVRTGIDVSTVDGGRVTGNWSVVAERRDILAPWSGPAAPASSAAIAATCHRWTPLWNGELELAPEIVADDFRIWFGAVAPADDELVGPAAMADYVDRHRSGRPDLRFAEHGELVVDRVRQTAALTWSATVPVPGAADRTVGGIDLFGLAGGQLARVWSITGARPFQF